MEHSTLWWIAAGVIVALELTSGSFYLLMLAFGAVAGGLVAYVGGTVAVQMVVASVVGLAAVGSWHWWRINHASRDDAPAQSNHDVLLDIGQTLTVNAWGHDGKARVFYRGAQWDACLDGWQNSQDTAVAPPPGLHRIRAMQGSVLILEKI